MFYHQVNNILNHPSNKDCRNKFYLHYYNGKFMSLKHHTRYLKVFSRQSTAQKTCRNRMSQAWAYLSGAAWRWTFQFIISCVFGDFNSKLTHFGEGDGVTNDIGEQYISIPQKFSYTPIGCIMVWCLPSWLKNTHFCVISQNLSQLLIWNCVCRFVLGLSKCLLLLGSWPWVWKSLRSQRSILFCA